MSRSMRDSHPHDPSPKRTWTPDDLWPPAERPEVFTLIDATTVRIANAVNRAKTKIVDQIFEKYGDAQGKIILQHFKIATDFKADGRIIVSIQPKVVPPQ